MWQRAEGCGVEREEINRPEVPTLSVWQNRQERGGFSFDTVWNLGDGADPSKGRQDGRLGGSQYRGLRPLHEGKPGDSEDRSGALSTLPGPESLPPRKTVANGLPWWPGG